MKNTLLITNVSLMSPFNNWKGVYLLFLLVSPPSRGRGFLLSLR